MNKVQGYLISVIIPIYNVEKYVGKCIQSVMEQSHKSLEIILVDDGSLDASGKICDRYAMMDSRIRVIHKKNGGLVSARKAGLDVARGDYIGFVDGDDYIESDFYSTLLNKILETNADFIHTGFVKEAYGKSIEMLPFEETLFDLTEHKVSIINEFVLKKLDILPSIWSKLFRSDFIRECYTEVPDQQSQGEDLICMCTALLKGKKMSMHRIALYHYNFRPGSLSDYDNMSNIAEMGGLYRALQNLFAKFGVYEAVKSRLDEHFLSMTLLVMKNIAKIAPYVSLFYFGKIDMLIGKKIIIYGAGNVGIDYYNQISRYPTCEIVGWVDTRYQTFEFEYREVKGAEYISEVDYDVIVIAVKRYDMAMQIKSELIESGVNINKIVWEEPQTIV